MVGMVVFDTSQKKPTGEHQHLQLFLNCESISFTVSPIIHPKSTIQHSDIVSVLPALIDSWWAANFIDQATLNRLNIPMQPLQHPLYIHAIKGGPIGDGTIMLCTQPLLQVSVLHQEHISFLINVTSKHLIILGFPLMHLHDP